MELKQMLAPSSRFPAIAPNPMKPEYLTIHDTQNDASALNEAKNVINNSKSTSFHIAVDDKEAIQLLPFNRNAWHCGDGTNGTGNRKSIGLEICYGLSGGVRYNKAEANAVVIAAQILKQYGWGIDRLKKHQDWSGKLCPKRILQAGRWNYFKSQVEAKLKEMNVVKRGYTITTGGFSGESLTKIHKFILDNNYYYIPARTSDGSISFEIGTFIGQGGEKLEEFLKINNYWYHKIEFIL